jgi:hypothetical protein
VPIEIGKSAGLPKVFDAERPHAMTADGVNPGEGRRMPIENRHDAAG